MKYSGTGHSGVSYYLAYLIDYKTAYYVLRVKIIHNVEIDLLSLMIQKDMEEFFFKKQDNRIYFMNLKIDKYRNSEDIITREREK